MESDGTWDELPRLVEDIRDAMRALRASEAGGKRDAKLRDHIILSNTRHAIKRASRVYPKGAVITQEDIQSAAIEGLIRAVDSFDPEATYTWMQHLDLNIKLAISREALGGQRALTIPRNMHQRWLKEAHASPAATERMERVRSAYSWEAMSYDGLHASDSQVHAAEADEARILVLKALASLPKAEARVIALLTGMADGSAHSVREVAQQLHLTEGEVAELRARGMARLRHPTRSARIEAFGD